MAKGPAVADRVYLVETDDGSDELITTTREAGLALAEQDGAEVVLYDRSTESYLTDPYPAGPWSDEDDAVSPSTELDRQTLESLGRHYLTEQLDAAEERGLRVRVHLAQGAGAEALAEAIERYGVDLVVLPASVDSPSVVDRVRGSSLSALRKKVDVPIRLVDDSGNLQEP